MSKTRFFIKNIGISYFLSRSGSLCQNCGSAQAVSNLDECKSVISDIEGKSYKFLGNGSLKLTPAGCFFDEIRKGISWESYPRNSYFKAVCKSSVHASCKANFGNYINFFPSPLLCIYIYYLSDIKS